MSEDELKIVRRGDFGREMCGLDSRVCDELLGFLYKISGILIMMKRVCFARQIVLKSLDLLNG